MPANLSTQAETGASCFANPKNIHSYNISAVLRARGHQKAAKIGDLYGFCSERIGSARCLTEIQCVPAIPVWFRTSTSAKL